MERERDTAAYPVSRTPSSLPARLRRCPTANRTRRAVDMTELIKIDAVEPLDGSWLRLTSSDGAIKDVDVGEILARGGVFEPVRDIGNCSNRCA